MKHLQSTAKKLETVFRLLDIFMRIAAVACLVGLGVIAVGAIFHLDPDQIGSGYEMVELGFLELQLTEGFAPDKQAVLMITAVELVLAFVCFLICRRGIRCIREILQPMTQGQPFHRTVSVNLKKLAVLSVILGMVSNGMNLLSQFLLVRGFDVVDLLLSERVSHINIQYTFDLSFLLIPAILLLLSCVFRYGEELQQLSDETL